MDREPKLVFLSLDGREYQYVGLALGAISNANPFQIECDAGLIGATVYVKMVADQSALVSARDQPLTVPTTGVLLVTSEADTH